MAELDTASAGDLREQQQAVGTVLRALAGGQGLQPVLDEVVEAATRLSHGERGIVALTEGEHLRVVADYGMEELERGELHARDRATVLGRVALSGDPVQIPDVLADPEYSWPTQEKMGYRALLGVPILLDGDLIGVVAVMRNVTGPYSDEEVELVKTFADQAAIAIGNARLVETVDRQSSQQRAVSGVMRAVARSQGLQPVLDDIVKSATLLSGVENGRLFLLEDGLLRAVANYGVDENFEHDRQNPHAIDGSTLTGRAALTRQPVHIPDVLEDPEYTYAGDGAELSYRSGITVPILLDEELIGAFGIVSEQPNTFRDEHIELLQTFADQAAVAIANARLIGAVERQLEQHQAIADVLRSIALAEGLEAVLQGVVDAAERLSHSDFGALYLVEGDVLRIATQHRTVPDLEVFERAHPHTVDRTTAIGRVALTRDIVHIPDVEDDPEYAWGGKGVVEYRTVLAMPIMVEGELIGAMDVTRREVRPFGEDEIELLRTFADQAAIAIANARLIHAVERQRTELSRFVSPQVAKLISSEDGEKMLAGHRAYVSVLFCDLRGFTAFTETAAPEELFEVLGQYHRAMGELVPRYEGTLEHFAGDGLMVFFNDPLPVEQHELQAVRFALSAQECFAELAAGWRKRGIELGLGIGIAAGYATLGRIGFEGRYDYGALGPVSNLASRLSSAAQPGQTLIAQRVHAAVEDHVEADELGELDLKGFGRPVVAYSLRSVVQSER